AEAADVAEDGRRVARGEGEDGDAYPLQTLPHAGAPRRLPGEDEVGAQGEERLQARVQPPADRGEVGEVGFGVVAGAPHHALPRAEGEERLGPRREEGDDPPGGAGEADLAPGVVRGRYGHLPAARGLRAIRGRSAGS